MRTAEAIAAMTEPPDPFKAQAGNTTLVCLMTDAPLDKAGCTRVARAAAAGVARAVEPVFSDVDGDVVFCLRPGTTRPPTASPSSRCRRSPRP